MKNFIKKLLLIFLSASLLFVCFSFVGCSNGGKGGSGSLEDFDALEFSLNYDSINLSLYDEVQLSVKNFDGVTFASSSLDVLTVDNNGKVTAVGYGSAKITASKDEKSDECVVIVKDEGLVPKIKINGAFNGELPLKINAERSLSCSILFNGKIFNDGSFNFITDNPDVATIDENGKITAKSYGKAVIDITASWRAFTDSIYLKEQIIVTVNHDLSIEFNAEETSIYTVAKAIDGKSYLNSTNLSFVIKVDGIDVTNEVSTRFSYDEDVLTISNNKVSPKKRGDTEISLVCEYEGIEYRSLPLTISVKAPVIDYTDKMQYFSVLGEENLIIQGFNGLPNKIIVAGEDLSSISDFSENGKVTIGKEDITQYRKVKEVIVSTELYDYKYVVNFATHIISSDKEFVDFIESYKGSASENGSAKWHVVLASDIDLKGKTFKRVSSDYFAGVFDGNGYMVSNFEISAEQYEKGLFGYVSGSIENVAFTNVFSSGANSHLISHYLLGSAKNVYVSGSVSGLGVAIRQGWKGSAGAFAIVENCIFNVNYVSSSGSVAFLGENDSGYRVASSVKNCFALGNAEKFTGLSSETRVVYNKVQEFLDAHSDEICEENGWSNYWKVSGKTLSFGGKTILVGDADVVNKEITALQSEKFNLSTISSNIANVYIDGVETKINSNKEVDLSQCVAGKTVEIIVDDGQKLISQPVFVVSHKIGNAEELIEFFAIDENNDYVWTETNGKTVYALLTNDIDCNGQFVYGKYVNNVFNGVFDGAGYSIKNLIIKGNGKQNSKGGWNIYGLFGNVSASSIIKNVAFINITSNDSNCDLISGAMAGTIQNIFVNGKLNGGTYGKVIELAWSTEKSAFGKIENSIFNVEYINPTFFFKFDGTDFSRNTIENVLVTSNATAYSNLVGDERKVYLTPSLLISEESNNINVEKGWSELWGVSSKFITFNGENVIVGEADVVNEQIYFENSSLLDLTTICDNPSVAFINGVQVDIDNGYISLKDREVGKVITVTVSNGLKTVKQPIFVVSHIINTAKDLENFFALDSANDYKWTAVADKTVYVVLTDDIDLKNADVQQRFANNYFTGVFDGLGHAISNFNMKTNGIQNSKGWWDIDGLFGQVKSDSTIKNLSLVNASATGSNSFLISRYFYGVLSNVYVKGNVNGSGMGYVMSIQYSSGSVENCIFNITYSTPKSIVGGEGTDKGRVTNSFAIGNANADTEFTKVYKSENDFIDSGALSNISTENGWNEYWESTEYGVKFNGKYIIVKGVTTKTDYLTKDAEYDIKEISNGLLPDKVYINGLNVTITDGKVSITHASYTLGAVNELTFEIDGVKFVQPFMCVTHVIDDETSLKNFFDSYSGGAVANGSASWYVVLTKDIDFKNSSLYQKSGSDYFAGVFDGLGHTISNVVISDETAGSKNVGFFGYMTGTIRNVAFTNFTVTDGDFITNYMSGTMQNVYVQGTMEGHSGGYFAILEFGWSSKTGSYGKMSNCIFNVTYTKNAGPAFKASAPTNTFVIGNSTAVSNTEAGTVYSDVADFVANADYDFSANGWSSYWTEKTDGIYFGQTKIG